VNVSVEKRDGVSLLTVQGEVDLSTSPRLREALQEAIEDSKGLVVDLQACSYMDSSGIATLVEALQGAGKAKIRLALARVTGRVKDIFTLARLESVFSIHPDVDAAVRSVAV